MTLAEIGKELNMTPQGVHEIERRALKKLRASLTMYEYWHFDA